MSRETFSDFRLLLRHVGTGACFMLVAMLMLPLAALASSWSAKTAMPTVRYGHVAVELSGKVYLIGGHSGSAYVTAIDVYDPSTDAWSTAKNLSTSRYGPGVAVIGGKILVAGGSGTSGALSSTEIYDPATNTWTAGPTMNTVRDRFALVVVGGKAYALGGAPNSSSLSASVEEYDPATNKWIVKSAIPTGRVYLGAVAASGKIYAVGGFTGCSGCVLTSNEVYDPATDSWATKAALPSGRLGAAITLSAEGKPMVIGGDSYYAMLSDVYIYDPATNAWSSGTSLPAGRREAAAVTVNGQVLIFGGMEAGYKGTATVFAYGTPTTTTPSYTITASVSPSGGGTIVCNPSTVTAGGNSTCTATPSGGYAFSSWGGDCTGTSLSCTLGNIAANKVVSGLFVQQGTTTTTAPAIPLADLSAQMPAMRLFPATPRQFRLSDPLGFSGIDAINAWAEISGDLLRIYDLMLGNVPYSADFRLSLGTRVGFGISGASAESVLSAPSGNPITGLDTSTMVAHLVGPPLRLSLVPVSLGDQNNVVSFAFDAASSSFVLEGAAPLPRSSTTRFSARASERIWWSSDTTIDEFIADKTRVDTEIPSGTDWNSAVMGCATAIIGNMDLGDYGLKTELLQIVASEGPAVAEDMRFHFAAGNPGSAELALSQLLWKGLAKGIEKQVAGDNGNAYGKAFTALANYGGYGGAIASGAGECSASPDYKSGLKAMLEGVVATKFPIGKCLADLGMKAIHSMRNLLSNKLVNRLYKDYQGYVDANDAWYDFDTRGDLGLLVQYVAEASNPETSPYQISQTQRDKALSDVKAMFARWKAAKTQSSTLKERLTTLKARFQSLPSSTKTTIASKLPESERSEAQVFGRYVELMSHARSRLLPYVPSYYDATDKDIFAEGAVDALLAKGQSGWNDYIAGKLQEWEPKIFAANPLTCARKPVATISGKSEWGPYHLTYTVSGVTAGRPTYSDGFVDYYMYYGSFSGTTLTVSGVGWADNPTPSDDFPYVLTVSISAGSNSQSFEYKAPTGEKLNKSFSLSVPIPSGATSGSFTMSVIYINSIYGNRGTVVTGSISP